LDNASIAQSPHRCVVSCRNLHDDHCERRTIAQARENISTPTRRIRSLCCARAVSAHAAAAPIMNVMNPRRLIACPEAQAGISGSNEGR